MGNSTAVTPVRFQDILAAEERLQGGVLLSPCPESLQLSELAGCRVFCKLDSLQRTGSFKERGARNVLLQLSPEIRKRGVIAASAGNHALGLAYHGFLLKIPVTVVMPVYAPLIKISTCRRFGARVVLHGEHFADARAHADAFAESEGLRYVHGYDDPGIIAGQGTMGLEMYRQVKDLDAVIAPIGGGGLLAGVALAIKSLNRRVRVIGVQTRSTPAYARALRAGHPVQVQPKRTLADGLAVPNIGSNAFPLLRRYLDEVVTVDEDDIALALVRLIELEKIVVEGAAATSLAALLCRRPPKLAGKRVVLALCGGNIDPTLLNRVIEKGLVADGRITRFSARISDRPGGLAALAKVVAEVGASFKEVSHDRTFAKGDFSSVRVSCTVETRDFDHIRALKRALRRSGIRFEANAG